MSYMFNAAYFVKCVNVYYLMIFVKTKERWGSSFAGSGHNIHRLIQLFIKTLLRTQKSETFFWRMRMREVNYEFDNLRGFRERIEFEQEFKQDIETWRALIEVEMLEESTAARGQIGVRKQL